MPKVGGGQGAAGQGGLLARLPVSAQSLVGQDPLEKLKPYIFHGVDLQLPQGSSNAIGTCPFCGREGKFRVLVSTGQWNCVVCRTGTYKGGGNAYTFLRLLWEQSISLLEENSPKYSLLAQHRKLLSPSTLRKWGVVESSLTAEWLVPGFGRDEKSGQPSLRQLYRYVQDTKSGKWSLLATAGLPHQVFGLPLLTAKTKGKTQEIEICEGPWDGMTLWEALRQSGDNSRQVLAVPGSNSFSESWLPIFEGAKCCLMYDSDHPKLLCRKCKKSYSMVEHKACPTCGVEGTPPIVQPAGYLGMQRVSRKLLHSRTPPREVCYLKWGENGYRKDKPSGYDVRDFLSEGKGLSGRSARLKLLTARVEPIPEEWKDQGRSNGIVLPPGSAFTSPPGTNGTVDSVSRFIEIKPCHSWAELVNTWRKPMKWTEGLDRALSVMLSCVISTKIVGDPLWMKILGPAGCGKSVLCEALSTNRTYIAPVSSLTGFYSGYKTDRKGEEDNGLIPKIQGKTMVTKDGDTLLQLGSGLSKVLAQARDLYDGTAQTHYGNQMGRAYSGVRMTWLLCGTSSLRQIDQSELGERFLDCVIMEEIDPELEDEILWRLANRADRGMSHIADGKIQTQYSPEMVKAMELTGGYVQYLRENAQQLLSSISATELMLRKCITYGKFVAYIRARPSARQDESAERELATRLVSQHVRLAKCLAAVLGRKSLDEEVMRRVRQTALDTARGKTLEICHYLAKSSEMGVETRALSIYLGEDEVKLRQLLRFLRKIGAAEIYTPTLGRGIRGKSKWRLTARLREIYWKVYSQGGPK